MHNTSILQANKNKILPLGWPEHILYHLDRFGVRSYKVLILKVEFGEAEKLYMPTDHPVFQLMPQDFDIQIMIVYEEIGQLRVTTQSFWQIYLQLQDALAGSKDLRESLASQEEWEIRICHEHMDLENSVRESDEDGNGEEEEEEDVNVMQEVEDL
ncbi:hypothetical protein DACRYDRAFT_110504 [Dacryopinax primogenitus]|uniref:Uncharacterized protein n=1 Tax=Dacryopinax primogenitus (strain DJM 731) TaxID=1858805 RepID=M5FPI7_DACPD|nr:uncharacterized protein DACRYDRAFT_110504 [Dacryopinax primogenitus]EJT98595.1 hypothetical protein DACRYDRAFT_110504 [Dacryopinax primogenitus]